MVNFQVEGVAYIRLLAAYVVVVGGADDDDNNDTIKAPHTCKAFSLCQIHTKNFHIQQVSYVYRGHKFSPPSGIPPTCF